MVFSLAGTASAASVPDQRLHPPAVSALVSCYYWGYSVGPKGVDGDFGGDTERAVKAFQADTYGLCGPPGLVSDGRVGKHTWSALRASDSCPTE